MTEPAPGSQQDRPPAPVPRRPTVASLRRALPDCRACTVAPRTILCLGATAALALLGGGVRVTRDRGRPIDSDLAEHVLVTVHPSSLLRAPDEAARRAAYEAFVEDLCALAQLLRSPR